MGKSVIIAHDDADLHSLNTVAGGWNVRTTDNGNEALELIQRFRDGVVAVVIDLDLPKGEALAVLREMRRSNPGLPVVALTRSDKPAEAAEAVGAGATECVFKPIAQEEFLRILQRITKSEAACRRGGATPKQQGVEFRHLNRGMREIQESLRMLAQWDVPVVFLGETGVGKEIAARELHRLSTRAHGPFIKINCAAVPSELLESELFGYEKGAFTGALRSKPGKFELADGGTVFLDEIGDMQSNLQAKLLHVLQDGELDRLGGRNSVRVDVRVLAATHRDLQRCVENQTFREDLFYRLNVASIQIPALRARKDEIMPLAEHFLIKHCKHGAAQAPEIPLPLQQAMIDYPWPGNVRELENVVRKFLVFRQPDALAAELRNQTSQHTAVSGGGLPRKAWPRPEQSAIGTRNGSARVGAVGTFSNGNGNGHGNGRGLASAVEALAGPDQNGNPHPNGTQPQEEVREASPVNGNGHAAEYRYSAVSQGDDFMSGSVPFGDTASLNSSTPPVYDPAEDQNGAAQSGVQLDEWSSDFAIGEQVSTLAQVEQVSREFEKRTILAALQRSTWNRKRAAKMLEIDYKGLLYKMKKLEIGHCSQE